MYERAATALTLLAGPTVEPVTVAEVMTRAHIDTGNHEPAPIAITVALGTGAGNVDAGAHRYLATFTTAEGETEPGIVSEPVDVVDPAINGQVELTAVPIGGAAVTARKLYRTAAGGSVFLYLATIADNTTSSYTDGAADASLGAGAPTVNTTGDPELLLFITSARMMAEKKTRRALCTQSWELRLDDFPADDLQLPRPPLQTVSFIKYVDGAGVLQPMDPAAYVVDVHAEPARVRPAYGATWPAARRGPGAVVVRYVAGYGAPAAVPVDLRDWITQRAATAWLNRGASFVVDKGITAVSAPEEFVDCLLDDYVVLTRVFN